MTFLNLKKLPEAYWKFNIEWMEMKQISLKKKKKKKNSSATI